MWAVCLVFRLMDFLYIGLLAMRVSTCLAMIGAVSFISLYGLVLSGTWYIKVNDDVQRFGRQELLRQFQLESLILAQNERWRQA